MKSRFDPQRHHRRSIRLKGFDYSSEGAYYVTIVTQGREHVFGEIVDEEMVLNAAGQMIVKWWSELPNKFPHVVLGAFFVMPNHFHGIIFIMNPVEADLRVSPDLRVDPEDKGKGKHIGPHENRGGHIGPLENRGGHIGPPLRATLSTMIQWFKTMTTNEYIRGVKQLNWEPFEGRLWQRNFYEHIIRDEKDLQQKTDYILDNPSRWDADDENPVRIQ
jgi:REP element-mobilizing transposase RayT